MLGGGLAAKVLKEGQSREGGRLEEEGERTQRETEGKKGVSGWCRASDPIRIIWSARHERARVRVNSIAAGAKPVEDEEGARAH